MRLLDSAEKIRSLAVSRATIELDTRRKTELAAALLERIRVLSQQQKWSPREVERCSSDLMMFLIPHIPFAKESKDRQLLALSAISGYESDQMFSGFSRMHMMFLKGGNIVEGAENIFDDAAFRPFLKHFIRVAIKGGKNRGEVYHMFNHNLTQSGLLSAGVVSELLTSSFPKETPQTIIARYKKLEGQNAFHFFHDDMWKSLSKEEKIAAAQHIMTGDDNRLQYVLMYQRWRWFEPVKDAWPRILASSLKKLGPREFMLLFLQNDEDGIYEHEEAVVREAFLAAHNDPALRVAFLQKARFKTYPEVKRQEFERLILDSHPTELLVLQNARPKVMPVDSFPVRIGATDSIFQDPALTHIAAVKTAFLPEHIQKLPPREIAHWKAWVARNLFFEGVPVQPESVARAVRDIEATRERIGDMPIFKDAHVIVAAHEETRRYNGRVVPRFATPALIAGIERQARKVDIISPHLNFKGGDYRVTPDSLEDAKKRILTDIVTCTGRCVLFVEMHGGTKNDGLSGAIYLSDGQTDNIVTEEQNASRPRQAGRQTVLETERTRKIEAEEIAAAFLKRYENQAVLEAALRTPEWIIFASCVSPNIGRDVARIMSEKGVPPPHMIFMSEYGQSGFTQFYLPIGHDFADRTLGLGQTRSDMSIPPQTVKRAISLSPRQQKSRPGFLVPRVDERGTIVRDKNGRPLYMQIGNLEYAPEVSRA